MVNQAILETEPTRLWQHFEDLNAIPRPSKKEERVIEFMKNFGEGLGLETIVDPAGNVIIRKPATAGMENRVGVILPPLTVKQYRAFRGLTLAASPSFTLSHPAASLLRPLADPTRPKPTTPYTLPFPPPQDPATPRLTKHPSSTRALTLSC